MGHRDRSSRSRGSGLGIAACTQEWTYDTVVEATGGGVLLRVTRAELAAAGEVIVGGAVLAHRSLVERAGSGDKGTLLLVAVHPENGALSYLVVHHLRPGQDILLREQCVTTIAPGHLTVTLPDEILNALPPYRPDAVSAMSPFSL